ncbi:ABC transporter substrate-binding protein/permease [Lacticaseibacillus saniviri]
MSGDEDMRKVWVTIVGLLLGILLLAGQSVQAATDLPSIQKRGYLIVGLSADYAPLEFHTTIDGQDTIVGADVAMAKNLASSMGVKLQLKEMQFDALIGALKTHKVDMIISGMSETPDREKQVTFSKPYLEERQVVLIRKSDAKKYHTIADFSNAKVGAQKQTTQEQLAKSQLPGAVVSSLDKASDVVSQVSFNKLDAGVLSSIVADAYVAQNKQLMTIDPKFATTTSPTAIAMANGQPKLVAAVNKVITKMNANKTYQTYLKQAYQQEGANQGFWAKYGGFFLKGAGYTLLFAILTVIFGSVIGTLLALLKIGHTKIGKLLANIYIEFIRGTPLMVQAFIVFFGTQFFGINLSAFVSGAIAMAINSGAYVAEIIRSGLNSVAEGQTEAARSLGLSNTQAMRYVIFPQALKNIWPALGNEFVTVIKESSVLSVIGATELMFEGSVVQGASFQPFLPMLIVAGIYFIMTFSFSRLLRVVEKRFN